MLPFRAFIKLTPKDAGSKQISKLSSQITGLGVGMMDLRQKSITVTVMTMR